MAEMTPKSFRLQRLLLIGSLALNFVIIGVIAGMFTLGGSNSTSQRFDLTAGPMTRAMDVERREALREALRESGVFRSENRGQIRADGAALLDTVRAETFDGEAFRAAIERQRARLNAGQAAMLDALIEQVGDMSADERAAFADRLEEQMRRPPPSRNPRPREE